MTWGYKRGSSPIFVRLESLDLRRARARPVGSSHDRGMQIAVSRPTSAVAVMTFALFSSAARTPGTVTVRDEQKSDCVFNARGNTGLSAARC